jgi:hypothetical protein
MLERLTLIREFEERLKWLVENGVPVGAVHLYIGQEAVAVGTCAAPGTVVSKRYAPAPPTIAPPSKAAWTRSGGRIGVSSSTFSSVARPPK